MAPFGDYQQHGQLMLQESAATSMVDVVSLVMFGGLGLVLVLGSIAVFVLFNRTRDNEEELTRLEEAGRTVEVEIKGLAGEFTGRFNGNVVHRSTQISCGNSPAVTEISKDDAKKYGLVEVTATHASCVVQIGDGTDPGQLITVAQVAATTPASHFISEWKFQGCKNDGTPMAVVTGSLGTPTKGAASKNVLLTLMWMKGASTGCWLTITNPSVDYNAAATTFPR